MGRSLRAQSSQWDALVVAVFALVAAMVFLGGRLSTPAECAWLSPNASSFTEAGVVPRAAEGCPVPHGTLVVDARVADGHVRYLVQPGDRTLELALSSDRHPLALRFWHAAGTLVFVASLFGLSGYALSRRRHDPAAGSSLVFSAALLGSTVVTVIGLPPSAAFDGPMRWLFAVNVGFVYSLAWGAMTAWALQFPTPLSSRLAGSRVRIVLTWLPALAWTAAATALGAGRPYPAWMATAVPVQNGITVVCLAAIVTAVWLQMARSRKPDSDPVQRQQLVWLGGSAIISGLLVLALWAVPSLLLAGPLLPEDLIGVPGLIFVAGLSVAMLRYRLFDLDVVLARTLVYSALTLAVVLIYLATVSLLTGFVAEQPGGIAVIGAVTVAVAVNPLRVGLQRAVNRALYGDRDDPYRALTRLTELLTAREVAWDQVAGALRGALRVPFVALADDTGSVVRSGTAPVGPDRILVEALRHGDATLGRLEVGTRGRGDRFTAAERRLLQDLAAQITVALRDEQLDREVRASRERLVLAREEERRMLRRTLHDEVGPTIAALSLRAETVKNLIAGPEGSDQATRVLDRIEQDATQAAEMVRRLAYDLRPPSLDERGLAEALREQFAAIARPTVHLAADPLSTDGAPLPAAVEAAAYRIAIAAVGNVVRHAAAGSCWVRLGRDPGGLEVTIADDGTGPPADLRAGVGITAMRERAAELGGTCTVTERPGGGTLVRAVLPIGGRS